MYRTCPKCGHERRATDSAPPGECPGCGLVFAKWLRRRLRCGDPVDVKAPPLAGWSRRLRRLVLPAEPPVGTLVFWGRLVTWVWLLLWGGWFVQTEYDRIIGGLPEINYSFLHRINLVFHEAGHVVFMPFGRFMAVLGGSLGQLIMPGVVAVAFLFKYRNPFGASVGLWWFAQSTLDLAPYINDASSQRIILLGGFTGRDRPGYHDWNTILRQLGILPHDHAIAGFVDLMGEALILAALAWGGCLLYRQWGNRRQSG